METSTKIIIFATVFSIADLSFLIWFLSQQIAFYIIIPIILILTVISLITVIKITGA